jgi:acyl-CoA thioesterase FadM
MLYIYRLWNPLILGYLFPKARSAEVQVSYLCTPLDIDFNKHLNASVYSIFCDAGRRHLIRNLGLVRIMAHKRWSPIVVDTRLHFYKEIPLWRIFTVTTRLIRIYDKSFIVESRFESHGNLHCVAVELGFFLRRGGRISREKLLALLPEKIIKDLPPHTPIDAKSLDPFFQEQYGL